MRTPATNTMGPIAWFLLIFLSVLWGGSFFFSKIALSELQPFTVVLGRVSIAAIVLIFVVFASGQRLPTSPRIWATFLVMGLLNNLIPFSLIFWGQTQIASSLAAILNATTPVWTILLAHFLTTDERLTTQKMIGVFIGLAGVIITIGLVTLQGLGSNVVAQVAVLGAAVSYALAGIYGKRFRGSPPIVTASGQVICTTLLLIPITLLVDKPWTLPAPSVTVLGAMLGLALLSTALAYIIYFRLLSTVGATNLLLVTFLIPVSAILLGVGILNERVETHQLVGMIVIGVSLIVIDGRVPTAISARLSGPQPIQPSTAKDKNT